jgi:pectate lyase
MFLQSASLARPLLLAPILLLSGATPPAAPAPLLAFPSAEGFGRFATGARGGAVHYVTTLADAGPGSFREAVSQPGRTVLFAVGGVIQLSSIVTVAPRTTIAGQTAPGDGITLYGNGLSFTDADETVVRYLRVRMGHAGTPNHDAVTISRGQNLIFDHVSVSWGRDENFSVSGPVRNVTLQNSIVAQGLHPHSAGGLIQTEDGGVSLLRNLYIDNHTRNVKAKGTQQFVNNVVYGWETGGYILGDSERKSYANVTDNYFIAGPSRHAPPFTRGNRNFSLYARGNFQDSTRNGRLDGTELPQAAYTTVTWMPRPFDYPAVRPLSAAQAYAYVRQHAGASLHRDAVDQRLLQELTSLGKQGGVISDEASVGGPGVVRGGQAPPDADQDGLPDAWERQYGLSPQDAADRNLDPDHDGYTNLEEYLQQLVGEGDGPGKPGR